MHLPPSSTSETIVAIATPSGIGGIGILRLSGPRATEIVRGLGVGNLKPRVAQYRRVYTTDRQVIDDGLVLWFPGPHSFTGEDVVELQVHGSPVLLQLLLTCCVEHGARLARAGEFSERAFLHGKYDLAQVEAIADLISASDIRAARAARRSLDGLFSQHCNQLAERLTHLRTLVEAAIDFSEESLPSLDTQLLREHLLCLLQALRTLLQDAERGRRVRDGWHIVLTGAPNVGKSSLLNALVGHQRAIVTDIAGTTRDVLREHIRCAGMDITLVDTAGLRAATDIIEREGVRRAHAELSQADMALVVVDAQHAKPERALMSAYVAEVPQVLWVLNKCDVLPTPLVEIQSDEIAISALHMQGIDQLFERIQSCMQTDIGEAGEGEFSARLRHILSLQTVQQHLEQALVSMEHASLELVAESLRCAHQALGEITGQTTADDLLGAIFSTFCIGK